MTPSTQDARATGLVELALRCEQATGVDRELDGRIWCALNGHRFLRFIRYDERIAWGEVDGSSSRSTMSAGMAFEHRDGGIQQYRTSPAYTQSLDEAVKLVPAGHDYDLHLRDGRSGVAYCFKDDEDYKPSVHAATPALALTAAALRALAASTKDMNHDG